MGVRAYGRGGLFPRGLCPQAAAVIVGFVCRHLLLAPFLVFLATACGDSGGSDTDVSTTGGSSGEPTTGEMLTPCLEYRDAYRKYALDWCTCNGITDEVKCFEVTAYPFSTCACTWLETHPADDVWIACHRDSMVQLRDCSAAAGCDKDLDQACSDADFMRQDACGQPSQEFKDIRFEPCDP